jgi:hypothetical protein
MMIWLGMKRDMDSADLSQLYYMRSVLGVRSVLLPPVAEVMNRSSESPVEYATWQMPCSLLVVAVVRENQAEAIGDSRGELLKKMVAAMKISWGQVSHVTCLEGASLDLDLLSVWIARCQPAGVLILSQNETDVGAHGAITLVKNKPCLMTLGLEQLLEQPQQKKMAWEQMQKLMRAML